MEYNRNDPATKIVPYIFLFKNRRTIKDNQERANQYTDLFGWQKNTATKRRKDIRTPTVKWMHLMYQIGATLLQACVVLPPADEKAGAHHFMKFNPYCIDGVTEKYIPSTRPGHYWSQMTCVSEYAEVIKRVDQYTQFNEVINNTLFIDTVLHAIIFDFVAFAGQHVGYYHEKSTLDKEDLLRRTLKMDILKENDPSFVMFGIRDAFLVISRLVRPINDLVKRTLSSKLTNDVDELIYSFQSSTGFVKKPIITVLYDRAQSPIFDVDVVTRTTEELSPIYVHTSDISENEAESSDMSYDRVDLPDSPMTVDSTQSPQFNIETSKYIEYVGGVRIVDYDQLGKYRKSKGYEVNHTEPEPEPEPDNNINEGEENVVYKDAITEFEKDISDDDENANENLEERQISYKNKFESLIKEHYAKGLKLNESEDNDKMIESNEINENTNIEPIEKQLKSLRIGHNIKSMKM